MTALSILSYSYWSLCVSCTLVLMNLLFKNFSKSSALNASPFSMLNSKPKSMEFEVDIWVANSYEGRVFTNESDHHSEWTSERYLSFQPVRAQWSSVVQIPETYINMWLCWHFDPRLQLQQQSEINLCL